MTHTTEDARQRAANVRLAVFDVDGVLTDGSLLFTEAGETMKRFHTLDGHGMKMLMQSGIEVAIISGRSSAAVSQRMKELAITHVFQGIHDKRSTYEALLASLGLAHEAVAAIGDDVVDLPILSRSGFAAAVPAAPAFVRERAHLVTQAAGGAGAAREFCDFILDAQGKLAALQQRYLA
ncbi:MAG: HAD hydrolase family protein [Betaproteobacteria bacterium]|nr:HAD hydrolase family protein [Betaproteobacteria bacterium]